MGKATIISGGTDGLYTIEIDAGAQQQASRVEAINQELTALAERIAQAETDYLATSTAETHAAGALNAAIENYAAAVQANPETASTADVDRLTGDYYTAARKAGEARTRLQSLLLQQRQLESDKSNLANAPASETRQAWCVDLTEDAAGEVATIEVPGEPGTVLVAPGGRAPSAGDGALLARELMTPEQAFFNAAILPGWQKWMPTFRTGTITAIDSDNDTADVSLDAATSSAQGLGVNQASSLSGVPVEYMECNAAAFEVGDPCVVRFDGQSWDSPRVVGFAREPKACGPEFIYVPIRQITKFVSDPAPSGRYAHPAITYSPGFDGSSWSCWWFILEGKNFLATRQMNQATVKSSYVCLMSQASEAVDYEDVDAFGASVYTSVAMPNSGNNVRYYRVPLGESGFLKTLKLSSGNLYIETARNDIEYQGVAVVYTWDTNGEGNENIVNISGSVVISITSPLYRRDDSYFDRDFPSAPIIEDEFVGNVSTATNADTTLRQIFNTPNIIKRISPSGSRSTYHLHKYAISGGNFQAIYKRGKAPA